MRVRIYLVSEFTRLYPRLSGTNLSLKNADFFFQIEKKNMLSANLQSKSGLQINAKFGKSIDNMPTWKMMIVVESKTRKLKEKLFYTSDSVLQNSRYIREIN